MADDAGCDAPVLVADAHDASAFDSGEPVLDDWLRRRARLTLRNGASRTYVVCEAGTPRVVGYFALSMGQILSEDVPGPMRRNMPRQIPAVVLGRLAIDRTRQGRGLGRALLGDAVRRARLASQEVSARLVIGHAISPAAEAFYLRHGFTRLPVEAPVLALDLVKRQRIAAATHGRGEAQAEVSLIRLRCAQAPSPASGRRTAFTPVPRPCRPRPASAAGPLCGCR